MFREILEALRMSSVLPVVLLPAWFAGLARRVITCNVPRASTAKRVSPANPEGRPGSFNQTLTKFQDRRIPCKDLASRGDIKHVGYFSHSHARQQKIIKNLLHECGNFKFAEAFPRVS